MSPPAAPFWHPPIGNATGPPPPPPLPPFPHPPFGGPKQQHDPPSAGFWAGVAIFIAVTVAWVLRYSYLASPHWLDRVKRWLGLSNRQRTRTPISHYPTTTCICIQPRGHAIITRPERAYFGLRSTDPLPLYRPSSNNFSSDVLQALLSLEIPEGSARPPSYRSRLSLGWDAGMRDTLRRGDQVQAEQDHMKQHHDQQQQQQRQQPEHQHHEKQQSGEMSYTPEPDTRQESKKAEHTKQEC